MKKTMLLLLLMFLMSMVAIGCGSDDADDSTDGDTEDGDTEDGDVTDGDVTDGDVTDGDVTDGDVTDGDVTDGDVTDGDVTDGDVTDGDVTDGDVTDGDVTDGDVTDGDVTDGDVTDGDVTDGDVTDGDECDHRAYDTPMNYPCNQNDECEDELCLFDGYNTFCSGNCESADDCAAGMDCFDGGDLGFVCAPTGAVLPGDGSLEMYAPCNLNADCAQEICQFSEAYWTFCTQPCEGPTDPICGGCGECLETEDNGFVCFPVGSGMPGDECGYDFDCENRYCLEGNCSDRAEFAADCEYDFQCKSLYCWGLDTDMCNIDCLVPGALCPEGYGCVELGSEIGACIAEEDLNKEFDADCTYDFECGGGICEGGYCNMDCSLDGALCPENFVCVDKDSSDTDQFRCVPAEDAGRAFGEDCSNFWNCDSGICWDGTCNLDCELLGALCPENFTCVDTDVSEDGELNRCVPAEDAGKAFGEDCTEAWNCLSGVCFNDACNENCTFNAVRAEGDSCPENYSCVFTSGALYCIDSAQVGTANLNDECTENYNCASGLICRDYREPEVDTKMYLYDETGTTLIEENDDKSSDDFRSRIEYTFETAGTYTIMIEPYFIDFFGPMWSVGYYYFSVNDPSLTEAGAEVEPNDTAATANPLTAPTTIIGYAGEEDQDWFVVTVEAGQTVVFETFLVDKAVCEEAPTCNTDVAIEGLPYNGTHAVSGADYSFGDDCTGWDTSGEDLAFDMYLNAGQRVRIKATPETDLDLSIYIGFDCTYCLSGVDYWYGNSFEALIFEAPAPENYLLVIDNDGTEATSLGFTLDIELDPVDQCGGLDPDIGCCVDDNTVAICEEGSGLIHEVTCDDGSTCGWVDGYGYRCSDTTDADPSGENPRICGSK